MTSNEARIRMLEKRVRELEEKFEAIPKFPVLRPSQWPPPGTGINPVQPLLPDYFGDDPSYVGPTCLTHATLKP